MVVAFWAGIPVKVTQDALLIASYDTQGNGQPILPPYSTILFNAYSTIIGVAYY